MLQKGFRIQGLGCEISCIKFSSLFQHILRSEEQRIDLGFQRSQERVTVESSHGHLCERR